MNRLAPAAFVLILGTAAHADPVVRVGDYLLRPETPGQLVQIFVSGGDSVQGLDFNVQVGDGGAATGGTDLGPIIEDVDLLSGIFAMNHTGQTDGSSPLLWNSSTTTNQGTVSASGLLAVLTISTVGVAPGTLQPLSLTPAGEFGGVSNFAGIPIQITNGSLQVVPEPSTGCLLFAAAMPIVLRLCRRYRRLSTRR